VFADEMVSLSVVLNNPYPMPRADAGDHQTLTAISNAAYSYALAAKLVESGKVIPKQPVRSWQEYGKNSAKILSQLANINFAASFGKKGQSELETAWFVAKVARAARILSRLPNQGRLVDYEHQKIVSWLTGPKIAKLITDENTMAWVSPANQKGGSTNRTFALLEAQARVLELAPPGPYANVWQSLEKYLPAYFVNCNDEICENKDNDRADGKHPAMGISSILSLDSISRRMLGKSIPYMESVKKNMKWVARNDNRFIGQSNQWSCFAGSPWEAANAIFGNVATLGPDPLSALRAVRNQRYLQDGGNRCYSPNHAWGFEVIAQSFGI
jgi:hypothetical protein